jgi:hypothetical protein
VKVIPPVPVVPNISKKVDDHLIDNTKSSKLREGPAQYKTKQSNFLITFVPNSSVREEVNPKLYRDLKEEIKSFAQFVLNPKNLSDIIKPAPGNDDPKWFDKVLKVGDNRLASIEDSKDSNKRLHTHIYLPVEHKTTIQLNLDNIRQIAKIMLEPLGIENPHINARVEMRGNVHGARDYVKKLGEGEDGEIIQ